MIVWYLACEVECSFPILILHVDVALGVDQEGHEAVELVLVTPPDVRMEWCVPIVQVIHVHTLTFQILQHFLQTEGRKEMVHGSGLGPGVG